MDSSSASAFAELKQSAADADSEEGTVSALHTLVQSSDGDESTVRALAELVGATDGYAPTILACACGCHGWA